MIAPNASTVPTKFLCIGNGHAGAPDRNCRPRTGARRRRPSAPRARIAVKTMSESASRAYPAAPTAHPTMSAPETSIQAWNHSNVFSTYGLTMTVNSVANWYTRLSAAACAAAAVRPLAEQQRRAERRGERGIRDRQVAPAEADALRDQQARHGEQGDGERLRTGERCRDDERRRSRSRASRRRDATVEDEVRRGDRTERREHPPPCARPPVGDALAPDLSARGRRAHARSFGVVRSSIASLPSD